MSDEYIKTPEGATPVSDDAQTPGSPLTTSVVDDAAARAEEYLQMAKRAQADLINYRRRADQEKEEIRLSARVDSVMAILPALDDFDRAIATIPAEARELPWVQGILLIERNLRAQVDRVGLERIDALGKPFDPWEHEAIMTDDSGRQEDDTVTAVIRPGYRLGNRVLRPAQVTVARRRIAE